jgi:hypothetical protein
MSDPNGWVLNPPTKFVTIHSLTSQAALNGQTAVVVGYLDDSRRYVVVPTLDQKRQVSLRADNLTPCGWLGSAKAQYQMLAENPVVRQQVVEVWDRQVKPKLPPVLQSPRRLAAAAAAVLLALVYLLGLSRTMLAISFVVMSAMVLGPILRQTTNPRDVARRVVPKAQELLRQSGLPLAARAASSPYSTGAVLAVFVALFVSGMIPPSNGGGGGAAAGPAPWTSSGWFPPSSTPIASQHEREHYYKLGFDDATAHRAFGESLPPATEPPAAAAEAERKLDETTLDLSSTVNEYAAAGRPSAPSYFGSSPPPPLRRKKMLGIGNVASIGFTGQALYRMGMSSGGDGRWSIATLYRNLALLPPWRMALLGLSVYRIASALLF